MPKTAPNTDKIPNTAPKNLPNLDTVVKTSYDFLQLQ